MPESPSHMNVLEPPPVKSTATVLRRPLIEVEDLAAAVSQVDRIGDLLDSGELKDIIAVPTSERTYEQAKGTVST